MKKIIILRSLFGYLLVLIIHLGILYISFNYFNVNSNGTIAISPAMYLTFAVIIISLAYFTWRAITQYSSLSEYLKTAEQLKIELNSSLSDVSFSPTPFDKFNYDNYFVGGLAGEGLYQTNNESIKILHLFQSGGIFFPQLFGSKCITVFETKFSDTSLCFILRRKNLSTTLNSVDSSLLKGWEYFFGIF